MSKELPPPPALSKRPQPATKLPGPTRVATAERARAPDQFSLRPGVRKGDDAPEFEGKPIDENGPLEGEFLRPVPTSFLARILGKQNYQIEKRLSRCPVLEYRKRNGKEIPYYDFITAISFLIEPRGNIDEWFASKNAATLPPYVNKMFWDAAHQRNRVMIQSNDLWHTEDVAAVLGRVGITIRERTQLWVEEIPQRDLLTDDQYKALVDLVHNLQNDIRDQMLEMAKGGVTAPMSVQIHNEMIESGRLPDSQNEG